MEQKHNLQLQYKFMCIYYKIISVVGYQKVYFTNIATHVWQFGRVDATNVPVQQLRHRVKGVLSLCHTEVTIQNTFWHRHLQHNTFHL